MVLCLTSCLPHSARKRSLYVGSPETVARRIVKTMTTLGASRFYLKYGMGPMVHTTLMENIRLFGTEVAPRVREQLALRQAGHLGEAEIGLDQPSGPM